MPKQSRSGPLRSALALAVAIGACAPRAEPPAAVNGATAPEPSPLPVRSCPAREPPTLDGPEPWVRNDQRALCCAPRMPSRDWLVTSRGSCLEHFAPGLPDPIVIVGHANWGASIQERLTYQQVLRFERGGTRLETAPELLDEMAELFNHPQLRFVFLHGTAELGEATTTEGRDALARSRVRTVVQELTRRGVPPERLIEHDAREFSSTRSDLSEQQVRALSNAPSVLLYGPPPKPREADQGAPERCYPGVKATLSVPDDQLEPRPGSTLMLAACLNGRCARGALATETLSLGDEVIVRLDGDPPAGATLAWTADGLRLVVRTVDLESRLRDGDPYDVIVELDGQQTGSLRATVSYPDSGGCRVANVSSR